MVGMSLCGCIYYLYIIWEIVGVIHIYIYIYTRMHIYIYIRERERDGNIYLLPSNNFAVEKTLRRGEHSLTAHFALPGFGPKGGLRGLTAFATGFAGC